MGSEGQTGSTFHALLIGIDHYPVQPLAGCVNDIDAVERMLLDSGLGIAPENLRRLTAPRPDLGRTPRDGDKRPTFENIRAAFAELASERVKDTDRVFIYYSGHGKRVPVTASNGNSFEREALVPVDFVRQDGTRDWLFDFEINRALRAIADRTRSITVVLDACHAAGAFRQGDDLDDAARSLDLELDPVDDPGGAERGFDDDAGKLGGGIAVCHVVSACLAHESARESTVNGKRHGLLTRALTTTVDAIAAPGRPTLTWDRIWYGIRADVMQRNSQQTPRMEGSARRLVFSGPPTHGDAGIPVTCEGNVYRIGAGEIAEITRGAELAIYDRDPAYFPGLGSEADRTARRGVVRVTEARTGDADATAVGEPFPIEAGARARLIKPVERLRCSVRPANPAIEKLLADSSLIQVVAAEQDAPLRLELHDGRWLLIDDKHGNGVDAPVLFALWPDDVPYVRPVLEHYQAYAMPLRMAERAAADLSDGVEIRVLRCPEGDLEPAQAQAANFDEVTLTSGAYQLCAGDRVCVRVRNCSPHRLKVALFDASSGEVSMLGDEIIEAREAHVFWSHGDLGKPYTMSVPSSVDRTRDRLVAIGRTSVRYELDHLSVARSFEDVLELARTGDAGEEDATRKFDECATAVARERWTAIEAIVEISGKKR